MGRFFADALLIEWEDVIVREKKRTPESAAGITGAIRVFFDDCNVDRVEYEHLVDEMPGPDADDHEHMAAAVARRPCTILTHNKKHFPSKPLADRGVSVADPDAYLCDLADDLPGEVIDTLPRAFRSSPPRDAPSSPSVSRRSNRCCPRGLFSPSLSPPGPSLPRNSSP